MKDELFQERVVRVEKPSVHFTLFRNTDGDFLGVSDTNELSTFDHTDDKAIWEQVEGTDAYRQVVTGFQLEAGPDADVIEAPAGSYIVYDSRIWHRAGVNRTPHKRSAMLQAVIPMYIMPFMDTSRPYKNFIHSPLAEELTALEHK